MDLYGQKSQSIPQKTLIIVLELVFLYLSYWILFQTGGNILLSWMGLGEVSAPVARRLVIFLFSLIVFLRMGFMMIYLLKRQIPWEESLSVSFAFALYYLGFALLVLPTDKPLEVLDFIGIALFAIGSFINTFSELQRHFWKKQTENQEKLYTKGLFQYAMHINYFGDVCWVTAYTLISRNLYASIIPLLLICFFVFYNIPKLDRYLASKYGKDFDSYQKNTNKLIPFLY
ncbi:MAG: DUF1295 domain-containing protein [Pleurocapsa sp. MO_226.B13]|nr:DUF1295 domain-containing protein [Pleurocapsa sp. MO_226.B13]